MAGKCWTQVRPVPYGRPRSAQTKKVLKVQCDLAELCKVRMVSLGTRKYLHSFIMSVFIHWDGAIKVLMTGRFRNAESWQTNRKGGKKCWNCKKSSLQIEREKQWLVVVVLAQAFMGSLFTAEKGSSESGSATKWIYKKSVWNCTL